MKNTIISYILAYSISFLLTSYCFPENLKILTGVLLSIIIFAWATHNTLFFGELKTTKISTYLGLILGISFAYYAKYHQINNNSYIPTMFSTPYSTFNFFH